MADYVTVTAAKGGPTPAGGRSCCLRSTLLRKGEEADEVLRFVTFWEQQYGARPRHLVFDSKLTTYRNLSKLNAARARLARGWRRINRVLLIHWIAGEYVAITPADAVALLTAHARTCSLATRTPFEAQ